MQRAMTHEPIGKPGGPGLWHMKGAQLPAYIQHIRNDLMQERGMPESQATEMAVGVCRKWAAGGGGVTPETRAKAAAAIAEFDRLRAKAKATRSEAMGGDFDADGLDASWDDPSGLPDLTGLGVAELEAADTDAGGEPDDASRAAKLGSGARFAALKSSLAAKGAADPGALAAWIGRKKYGKAKFGALAGKARRKAGAASRSEIMRFYEVDDIRILTRGEGDGSGRVVEAYAAVFDQPAAIRDHQGSYTEIIDRGAFNQVLSRFGSKIGSAVRVLYNHGRTMEGQPAAEFQRPLGRPLEVVADQRGLLTRTEYAKTPLAEEILELIRAGAVTTQSFVGGIVRSDPELRGPGDRYRKNATVRRMALGLREYGPVLWAAYSGAEILGVRMSAIEDVTATDGGFTEDWVEDPDVGVTAGSTPEVVHPSRQHAHRLWQLHYAEACRLAGIAPRE